MRSYVVITRWHAVQVLTAAIVAARVEDGEYRVKLTKGEAKAIRALLKDTAAPTAFLQVITKENNNG